MCTIDVHTIIYRTTAKAKFVSIESNWSHASIKKF